MKQALGLDLGTNSIGWALIDADNRTIIKAGSRIIPMDAGAMSDFDKGNLQSSASERTGFRGTRRLYERATLRRERLLRVLNILGFLPKHYQEQIDFEKHPGQFKNDSEPLLPYQINSITGKRDFIFKDSFNEMLAQFAAIQPQLVQEGKKIPYDWTIYYLRAKALTAPIKREELAWIILNFNTKRGYYQLRGEETETTANKRETYATLKVVNVERMNPVKDKTNIYWYEITYENGAVQRAQGPVAPRKIGDEVELIVTTTLDKDGQVKKDKEGCPMIKLRSPKDDDWTLLKKRTECDIDKSGQHVGEYIYHYLLQHPQVKVRGQLVRTIERKYYKDELIAILDKQREFLSELQDSTLYEQCVRELYHQNESHVYSLQNKGFTNFFVNDIIFYQRPLKSKKSEIANCPYESYQYVNKKTGEIVHLPIKCIHKSHPLYQEYRLWQFIHNLRIYQREKEVNGKWQTDVDVTHLYLTSPTDYVMLFNELNERDKVTQKQFLNIYKLKDTAFRWNYVDDKTKDYPCNKTHYDIQSTLHKVDPTLRLTIDDEIALWHILYSVDDTIILDKALHSFAQKRQLPINEFVNAFRRFKPFENEYGAYSEKAIKKLLPLMRIGLYWNADDIDSHTLQRIQHIINGVKDEGISDRVREKLGHLHDISSFQGLPVWQACYAIYNRHSETADTERWQSPADIDYYLTHHFKQHALRNPVVEQVLSETIRVVRDIWNRYGTIHEIHVEMGRNLKLPAQQRAKVTDTITKNERTNLRIRALLQEFVNPDMDIKDVRPFSPTHHEKLKIYEENILSTYDIPDDIQSIINDLGTATKHVSHSEVIRYKLWLEQKYQSPYTGQFIPLSRLFTTAYEIEHIIPQSRYFDNSLSNKVICESEVNKLKDRMLGYEFILKHGNSIVGGSFGRSIKILSKAEYEEFVKQHYAANKSKMKKLLLEDIPDDFINRQLNDSRYIARKTTEILSKVVREEGEQEAISKNVIMTTGAITDQLKKDWGLTAVWDTIITPRFERLNEITGTHDFGEWVSKDGKRHFQINLPLAVSAGFSKKRIDHRHHAMDAIVIACTTRDHINYLNNAAATSDKKQQRYDLKRKLCITDAAGNVTKEFKKPWPTFTQDAQSQLETIIVSFKQNLRVINRMSNFYWNYVDGKKKLVKQTQGDGWAIRKSLHKATVYGAVRLQSVKKVRLSDALDHIPSIKDKIVRKDIKGVIAQYGRFDKKLLLKYYKDRGYKIGNKDISKLDIFYTPAAPDTAAVQVALDTNFDEKTICTVTDTGIQKILLAHLHQYDDATGKQHPELAFSPEGIATMNRNLTELNGGKPHQPIYKVRKTEALGLKFQVGEKGNKQKKYVEADKGTNLFFAIYSDEQDNRSFESIPFNHAVQRMKMGEQVAPAFNGNSDKLLFTLSPNDLVYMPNVDEEHIGTAIMSQSIYKMVSANKSQCFFTPAHIASPIIDTIELGSNNKAEKSWDGRMIKKEGHKVTVDRLGNITNIHPLT